MKAVVIAEPTGASGLRIEDVPDVKPGKGQLLVEVKAAGLNRADLLQSMGLYPASAGRPRHPGHGVLRRGREGGRGLQEGRPRDGPGAAAARSPSSWPSTPQHALQVPKELSDTDAAGVVEAFITA